MVVDVTPGVSSDRAERATQEMILDIFWPIQASFVVREPLCDLGAPS